ARAARPMLFCSWNFVRFFAVVLAVYWLLPWRRLRWAVPLPGRRSFVLTGDEARVWWLVAASIYFYACWNRKLALLICATTLMAYFIGLGLAALPAPRLRRGLLLASITANLGVLVYFKYANFFLGSLEQALRASGASVSLPVLRVILPV